MRVSGDVVGSPFASVEAAEKRFLPEVNAEFKSDFMSLWSDIFKLQQKA